MWDKIISAYEKADKNLGGWLPGGNAGNPLSNKIRETIQPTGLQSIPVIGRFGGLGDAMFRGGMIHERNKVQQEKERLSSSSTGDRTKTHQINLMGPSTTAVRMCPVNRDSYRLAKSAAKNYRMNTQDTPGYGFSGCVESVQRNFDDAGLGRIATDSWFAKHARDTNELRKGILDGRGYSIDINSAAPGDIVIQNGDHTGIVTDRKNKDGKWLVVANSGSHGSFSDVKPLENIPPEPNGFGGFGFEVFRLGERPQTNKGLNLKSGVRR